MKRVWVLSLVLPLIAAGCGGGGDSSTTAAASTTSVPTRADYITRADATCRLYQEALRRQHQQARAAIRQGDFGPAARHWDHALGLETEEARRIEALPPPPSDEEMLNAIFSDVDRAYSIFGRADAPLEGGDIARFHALADQGQALVDRADKLSVAYGFRACGR